MRGISYEALVAEIEHELIHGQCIKASDFFGCVHLRDSDKCWRRVDECSVCRNDIGLGMMVFHDEVTNRIVCFDCVSADEQA